MKPNRVITNILILLGLAGLALLLNFVMQGQRVQPHSQSVPSAMPGETAFDERAMTAEDATDSALSQAQPEIATPPPLPTARHTPFVTPVPAALFPLADPGSETGAWGVVYRSGNSLRLLDLPTRQDTLLVDSADLKGLFLAPEALGPNAWGQVAPDGNRIALTLGQSAELPDNRKGTTGEWYDLYLFNRLSGELALLVEGATEPKWSPDGARIAYTGGDSSLWVLEVASGKTQRLYQPDANQGHYVNQVNWSPDSAQLAFLDQVFRDTVELHVVSLEGRARLLVPWEGYQLGSPRWSPEGRRLAFTSFEGSPERADAVQSLWLVEIESGRRQQLTDHLNVFRLSWALDGTRIFFDGSPRFEQQVPGYEIWYLDLADGGVRRLTDNTKLAADETLLGLSPGNGTLLYERQAEGVWALSLVDGSEEALGPLPGLEIILFP